MFDFNSRYMYLFGIGIVLIIGVVIGALLYYNYQDDTKFDLDYEVNFDGKVVIVGAGASGLTAGYILEQKGIDYVIIEASDTYGGRLKESVDFADFPIDLGAEWIHEDPAVLNQIVQDQPSTSDIEFIEYQPQTLFTYQDGELNNRSWQRFFYKEYKFKNTTWFNFFETYIVPSVQDNIVYNRAVSTIDYTGSEIRFDTVDGSTFEPTESITGDKALVTVPIGVLRNEYITFDPDLPEYKVSAINSIEPSPGFKAFIDFDEKFYPDLLTIVDEDENETIAYDATFRKDFSRNILGLLVVGNQAQRYLDLDDDQQIIDTLLAELDEIYDGAASAHYNKHLIRLWSNKPFIQGTYSTEYDGDFDGIIAALQEPLNQKVYFSGAALSRDRWSTVPGASETAYVAIKEILTNP